MTTNNTSGPAVRLRLFYWYVTLFISAHLLQNYNNFPCWFTENPCKCQGNFNGLTYTIRENCLPEPYQFNKYYFSVMNKNNNVQSSESICIVLAPKPNVPEWLRYLFSVVCISDWERGFYKATLLNCVIVIVLYHSFTCTQGCDPVNDNTDAKFKLDCQGNEQCQNIVWNIDDPNDDDWPVSLIEFWIIKN